MEYRDLTELLLGPIRERPGMYLGRNHISFLPNFIIGYMMAIHVTKPSEYKDRYFDSPGFIKWFYDNYRKELTSFWHIEFLEEAKGDEQKALELYFNYLEKYSKQFPYIEKS